MPSESPGNFITGALFNATIKALGDFLAGTGSNGAPMFFGYQATAQAVATGTTGAPLTLDVEIIDTDGGHSTTSNTSRYVCQVAGFYLLFGCVTWLQNATDERIVTYAKNGTTIAGGSQVQANPVTSAHATVNTGSVIIVPLAVGDYVEVVGAQNSGGSLSTAADVAAGKNCSMLCMWVHA
ncbi:hypothetical protein HY68_01700 [Streptomyces sp. AcH 505]|uniref:hypothetical protein n=1 Tax=Streptomyces sp. AcH 505 TaxID=352211 RepID=UPI0005920580|nr:hypothetical protein HY68_01700 [Streptomyces sp. AcH 505]